MYSSGFTTIPASYVSMPTVEGDTREVLSQTTISALTSLMGNGWYCEIRTCICQIREYTRTIVDMPVLANTGCKGYIGFISGDYGEYHVTITDGDGHFKSYNHGKPSYYRVCTPNENNAILLGDYDGSGMTITLSKMKDEKDKKTKIIMQLTEHGGGTRPENRGFVSCSVSEVEKNVEFITYVSDRNYSSETLARELITDALYSVDTIYTTEDMYISVLDTEILGSPKSVLFDDTEYIGINFNPNRSGMYNHYFKVQKGE